MAKTTRLTQAGPVAVVLMLAAVGWLVLVHRMGGMDGTPGGDLGGIGWFTGIWLTMTAAMMLPAVVPAVAVRGSGSGRDLLRVSGATGPFLAGYVLAWMLAGLAGFALVKGVYALQVSVLGWHHAGRYVSGAVVFAAGAYQLTTVKARWLCACRDPLALEDSGSTSPFGSLRTGLAHGGRCVACCWALMLALYALGIMSIVWMVLVTVLIAAERLLPRPLVTSRSIGILLVVLGFAVAFVPRDVPALNVPSAHAGAAMSGMGMGMKPGR